MAKSTDVRPASAELYFIPCHARLPLKFGTETTTFVTLARVKIRVENEKGQSAIGWGETPLSVTWVWPSALSYAQRDEALQEFCRRLAKAWATFKFSGHAMEIGAAFIARQLPALLKEFNQERKEQDPMPWLAALVCCSLFDLAVHDAYGQLNKVPVYKTYNAEFMNMDLAQHLTPADGSKVSFKGRYPAEFLNPNPPKKLLAWHLIGGKDFIHRSELDGSEPKDGYPVLLDEWIKRDGLKCLKVKLRGNDAAWDYDRLVQVGKIAVDLNVVWLTADFNCTVTDPAYVNDILDRLMVDHPRYYAMMLYVEQPFPYELEENQIDVHSVAARKPLFMDESAHDWHVVKLGRTLGWTGVALKTCKTQTGALLTLCWAKAHGMTLMVQDLSNPTLAQIPHTLLAAHAGTIAGVETNGMQFFPEASKPEAVIHPGLYQRRDGMVDLSTISGPGFGYRVDEIKRTLPARPRRHSSGI